MATGARLVIGNRNLNVDALIGHGRGEFVTPLDEAHGATLEQPEKVDVRELIFFIESIQIEVEERKLVSDVLEQDVERRARDLIVNAEACGKALGKLRLACTKIAAQHNAVVHLHESGDCLAQPYGVVKRITSTVNQWTLPFSFPRASSVSSRSLMRSKSCSIAPILLRSYMAAAG